MSDIFISYASEDRERVKSLAETLEQKGWSVWWDRRIPIGQSFDEVIEESLDVSKAVVVVWTETSVKSQWVKNEAREGLRRRILFPVMLLDDVKIPLEFRDVQTAHLMDWQPGQEHPGFNQFVGDLTQVIGSPSSGGISSALVKQGEEGVGQESAQVGEGRSNEPAGMGQSSMLLPYLPVGIGIFAVIGALVYFTAFPQKPTIGEREDVSSQPPVQTPHPRIKIITGQDGVPMVLIPAGSFSMGSTSDEVDRAIKNCLEKVEENLQTCRRWYQPELPQHTVQIDAFYLDRYEVTNRRFEQFVRDTGHRTTAEQEGTAWAVNATGEYEEVSGADWEKPEGRETVFASNRDKHPVVSVSWVDAQAYCRWVGKRLPTEAEFAYATRAGTQTVYWWGNGNPGSRLVANIADESAKQQYSGWANHMIMSGYDDRYVHAAPVGSFEQNPFGLHDMTGNVAEWTADWYDERYYSTSPARNPQGPSSGQYRVVRGGSWTDEPDTVRSAFRYGYIPSDRSANIGFRCAQDVPT